MCKKTIAGEARNEQSYDQELNLYDDSKVNAPLMPSTRRRSVSPQRYCTWKTSAMQTAWAVHFSATTLVLLYGSMNNQERKYMSVDASNVPGECVRAFVDVFANSELDEGALICCDGEPGGLLGICDRTPSYLPFARRLSQFPEAWMLPIFPFLLRGLVRLVQCLRAKDQSCGVSKSEIQSSTTLRRLGLSFFILLLRGTILYSFLNFLEHFLVPSLDEDAPCWYKDLLKNFQTPCSGRTFDFSDHVVLYFAQLIPAALAETLYCLSFPFWKEQNRLVPLLLVLGLLYLYLITFLGAFKTSAYYHTPAEIWTGWVVSMVVQLPLCMLQCSRSWKHVRSFFYGQRSSGYDTLLIQAR